MEYSVIEKVVLNQQEDLEEHSIDDYCYRAEEEQINLNSNLAQVVIGMRRSGKSTLCINRLKRAGVEFAYLNFDDERLFGVATDDLDTILEAFYKIYGDFKYMLLDEIQNVEGWPLFVNRMLRKKLHVILTGSNSKLLSGELATHLTGRAHQIELYPFSFIDFCNFNKVELSPLTTKRRGFLAAAFDKYLLQGGLPELMNEDNVKGYINTLTTSIINQDIKKRFNVRYVKTLTDLTNHLLNEAPAVIVQETLMRLFNFRSSHTLSNYLSYLQQTYLISPLNKYSTRSRLRVRNMKYYPIDVAFMNERENAFAGENLGLRLETIVYLELRRRTKYAMQDVYYYENGRSECDFVVCDGNRTLAVYQVSYSITNPKTYNREIRGCINGAEATGTENIYLLTYNDTREPVIHNGHKIIIMSVWEWLIKQ